MVYRAGTVCRVLDITLCLEWMGSRHMTSTDSLNDHIIRRKMVPFNAIRQVQYLGIEQRKCFRPLYLRVAQSGGVIHCPLLDHKWCTGKGDLISSFKGIWRRGEWGGGGLEVSFYYNIEKNYEVQNPIAVTVNDISFRKFFFSKILQRYLQRRCVYWSHFHKRMCACRRSQWPRGLRRRSAAARLLRSWVRILLGGMDVLYVVNVVCCQVEVSATSWSLVQRSPTDCAASLCVI